MKKLIFLAATYFLISSCSTKPKEFITFSQRVEVKDVIYLGEGAYQVQVDVNWKNTGHIIHTGLLIHHPVAVGETKTYVEYETENEFGQRETQSAELR